MFQETQRKFIESDTLEITVMPYPKSPPADFTGAVGQFSIESWLDTSTVSINEAITLHVRLEGTGNLNQFKLSPFSFPQNMEVFPRLLRSKEMNLEISLQVNKNLSIY